MRTVIFDLDGTLADTAADLIAAANAALAGLGHAPQLVAGDDDAVAFRGGRAMLDLAFTRIGLDDPQPAIAAGYPMLLRAYGAAIDTHTRLYPGAGAAVERLRGAGVAVGVCTNKPEALAERLLDRLGVRGLFGSVIGADTLSVRKPAPEPFVAAVERAGGSVAHSLLVGDTRTDRDTARAAGVPSVLVTFGPDGAAVAELAPEALIDHFDELDGVVTRLLGPG